MQLSGAEMLPTRRGGDADDAAEADEKADILIVDDLPEKLLVFGTVLEELGQNLVFVRSGADALREVLLREFAVILLDVNMPDIDGFETAALIRQYKRSSHTPIIFITAYADEMQTARGYQLGAVDYILSPVVPEVLRSKVKVFVELHAMQRRVRRQAEQRVALAQAVAAQHAAEDNDRRSKFLADAGHRLGSSLDFDVNTRRLLELVVPAMASQAVLLLVDREQPPEQPLAHGLLASKPAAPDAPPGMREIAWSDFDAGVQAALAEAMDGRRRVVLPTADRWFDGSGTGARAQGGLQSALAVPLVAGAQTLGVLLVSADSADGSRAIRDWAALEELAGRAAIAFENARLYRNLQSEIAERSAAEAELQRSNQRKDEFLAMLSHELRNPLAPIRNAVEVMRRVAPPEPKLAWAIDVVDRQGAHLSALVDELLDVARISQGKIVLNRERVDLNAVLAMSVEAAQPMFDARRQVLAVGPSPVPVWLQGDSSRLAQVIGNLLHNASKFSDESGRIDLKLGVDGGQARLVVRDSGVGIDPLLMPNIFELFAQGNSSLDRSEGGLGVGLTLVRRLVELHGGTVRAKSDGAGQGAEFEVLLPCVSVVGDTVRVSSRATLPKAKGSRVLIVDDNPDAAESIALFLQLEGHDVKSVNDPTVALAAVPTFAPQVVLLDIGLPIIDGFEVARRMRAMRETRDALLIAVSGYGQAEDRRRSAAAGFDHHFLKPTDPRTLVEVIAQWQRGGGRQARAATT